MTIAAPLPHTAFAALGDPVRAAIVERLSRGDATVSALAADFPISLQAVSRHVRVLVEAGLVAQRSAGRTRPVTLDAGALERTADWLRDAGRRREQQYERLDGLLARMQQEDS
ncbi:metalloregulator ArsR/SmtB family transcription factor [Galbitalea sp. SE-J8]|uniref:ArsR/SmtB family transcription factor n=1 Tax=Galbitalea sp. SE-J8 TaxID=3054952 RepID=UPI00259D28D3|nr:metalloregulator ArsR/SmtB family transcription factor [Galbitalea sp. SE-J8]MDM4761595.1 metalloregulator ArsR/SmtB family transcription factor [Galbitalea sp. SE-J8]